MMVVKVHVYQRTLFNYITLCVFLCSIYEVENYYPLLCLKLCAHISPKASARRPTTSLKWQQAAGSIISHCFIHGAPSVSRFWTTSHTSYPRHHWTFPEPAAHRKGCLRQTRPTKVQEREVAYVSVIGNRKLYVGKKAWSYSMHWTRFTMSAVTFRLKRLESIIQARRPLEGRNIMQDSKLPWPSGG